LTPSLARIKVDDSHHVMVGSMNRRDMMKLVSLAMLPMMPGAAMASSDSKTPPLRYKVFTVTRPGLKRDVPPGKEHLMWVANSATLIYGEQDAVLVDTFLTVEQSNGLADAVVASGKTLKAIYVTHAHGDHFFGIKTVPKSNSGPYFHRGLLGRQ
jgi:hypothetical protein